MNDPGTTLRDRILAELQGSSGLKAGELAERLRADRPEVSRCLAFDLAGLVRQGADYRWHLRKAPSSSQQARVAPSSELANLCRYYLECIGQDMDEGVGAFASNAYGAPEYAELPRLPLGTGRADWFNEPGVERVLGDVRKDRSKLVAWLGYPVRLRRHRTPKWEGFFVEPVLLWRVELGERSADSPEIDDTLPTPNPKVLRSVGMGGPQELAEESARLTKELGLDAPRTDLPDVEDVIERLVRIRPDWDWKETLDPTDCRGAQPLARVSEPGIYNRAVVLPGQRSPFTLGLENELKALESVSEDDLRGTALGQWLSGDLSSPPAADDVAPLIEVLPMNGEQRAAVRAALSAPLTVVTGPPGTGKSQVVTNLVVNAAWRGMRVLFASKNNKAVDVVEARVNGLGSRPVLLRLGAKEYQTKLPAYLTQLLSGNPGAEDQARHDDALAQVHALLAREAHLDALQQRTLDARNAVDRLDRQADDARRLFRQSASAINEASMRRAEASIDALAEAINAADRDQQGWAIRLAWSALVKDRLARLEQAAAALTSGAGWLGVKLPPGPTQADLPALRAAIDELRKRFASAESLLAYQHALDVLTSGPSFEDLARQRTALTEEVAEGSLRLWREWVQLAPLRLTPAQRKDVADYVAALQALTGTDADRVHSKLKQRARELHGKVTQLFTCWAVTSLSARGRVPFEPGHFDLVVIDEASQCDIASALPLLYRAKRSVIIGDPQQLRHISALTRPRDSELQNKHGLVDTRLGWMYSVSSLYDVAAGVVTPAGIVNLRDHHRSHADIIQFSNRAFYEGRLRVATRYKNLKRPRGQEAGIVWDDIPGRVTRPASGGAQNRREAEAVVQALVDLLVRRSYPGTVGVVTPFRAQAGLLQELVTNNAELQAVREKSELLVDTVHSFQGDERDVMFFSPVVSQGTPAGALHFLRGNGNLFNVAITRARGLLHVVGDRSAAANSGVDYLADFESYVADLGKTPSTDTNIDASTLGAEYPIVARPEQVSDWERVLYRALYAAGVRAIPQYRVEQYDLDFAVIVGGRRLNIEVDGERYHRDWTGELCLRDRLRNQRMMELGWDVKRFWVYEIRDRIDECVAMVVSWVEEAKRAN